MLIDTSNSIRERFRFQQEAAVEFINSVMRPQDKAVVVSFDTGPELVADLTNDTASSPSRPRVCVPAAERRFTTPYSTPAGTSCSRISRATNSAAP